MSNSSVEVITTPQKRPSSMGMTVDSNEDAMMPSPVSTRASTGDEPSVADGSANDPAYKSLLDDHPDLVLCHTPPSLWEVALCSLFFLVGCPLSFVGHFWLEPRIRPMPVQYLEGSQEYVRNLVNNEEYNGETIGTIELIILCWICPFLVLLATFVVQKRRGDIYRSLCAWGVAVTLTGLVTIAIKAYVGYLRPAFFAYCEPDDQYDACTTDEYDSMEGRKSFISGHASFAFSGGVLFTMFLERVIGLSSVEMAVAKKLPDGSSSGSSIYWTIGYKKNPSFRRLGSLVALFPMAVATWVACSRVVDNQHFPADILGGALVGACIAYYCQTMWFPEPRFLP